MSLCSLTGGYQHFVTTLLAWTFIIREALETEFHPKNMNRKNDLVFSMSQKHLIHSMKKWRKPHCEDTPL
jgi:hypothetical protein